LGMHRNELIISSKAGWDMWPGPYGVGGSRKYLLASLDESLVRMGLDYVDIFYSHRPTPEVPLEETMGALVQTVRQGKALYVGISSYSPERTREAARILKAEGVPLDPSAVLLDAEPLDRAGLAEHSRRTRRGLHCLLPPRTGPAHGQISQRRAAAIPSFPRRLIPEVFS